MKTESEIRSAAVTLARELSENGGSEAMGGAMFALKWVLGDADSEGAALFEKAIQSSKKVFSSRDN